MVITLPEPTGMSKKSPSFPGSRAHESTSQAIEAQLSGGDRLKGAAGPVLERRLQVVLTCPHPQVQFS